MRHDIPYGIILRIKPTDNPVLAPGRSRKRTGSPIQRIRRMCTRVRLDGAARTPTADSSRSRSLRPRASPRHADSAHSTAWLDARHCERMHPQGVTGCGTGSDRRTTGRARRLHRSQGGPKGSCSLEPPKRARDSLHALRRVSCVARRDVRVVHCIAACILSTMCMSHAHGRCLRRALTARAI